MSMQTSLLKETHVPLSQIVRPIQPVLDTSKIDAMVSTYKGTPLQSATLSQEQAEQRVSTLPATHRLPPIDLAVVRYPDSSDDSNGGSGNGGPRTVYYAFGGCHRLQAYDALSKEQNDPDIPVLARLMPMTPKQLKLYVGVSP